MRHVEHQRRLAGDDLEAARQLDHGQAIAHRLGVDRQSVTHRLEHCQRAGGIDQLIGATQRRIGQAVEALLPPAPGPLQLVTLKVVVATQQPQVGADRISPRLKRRRRNGVADDHRLAWTHDAGFFERDRLAVAAEKLGVVERDAGDQCTVGIDRVDRIEPPAHADLQNHQVEWRRGQRTHDGQGGELEPGQRDALTRGFNRLEMWQQRFGADHRAVDAAPLLKVHQVRLDVDTHPVASLQRHRLEHRA